MDSDTGLAPRTAGDGAWDEIATAWQDRDFRTLHDLVEGVLGVSVAGIDDLLDGDPAPENEAVAAELEAAFASARSHEHRVLLAFYVYATCLSKWERSADYDRIRCVVRALDRAVGMDSEDGHGTGLIDVVVAQASALVDEMAVESALNCSCPAEAGARARRVVAQMDSILGALDGGGGRLAALAARDAQTQREYFGAIARTADVVDVVIAEDGRVPPVAAATIEQLEDAEHALRGDVYESELRAHRVTLAELLRAETRARLHVEQADLVYLYPFAIEGVDPTAVDGLVARHVAVDAVGADAIEVHALQLNDLWGQPDRAEYEAGYGGVSIRLPAVRVTTTAKDAAARTLEFEAEVRLSRLGNHHLRVTSKLADASLHVVNQALRRGSRCMGEEQLESNGRRWSRFMEYASDVIASLARLLRGDPVGDPRANFHVVLAARAISVLTPGSEPRPAQLADLRQAVGSSLLFHPLPGLASALEEWVRYPAPAVRNLLDETRYADELAARTANTTVLYMPSSPEWRTDGYEQMIEFVASVPPLLTLWQRQATAHADKLERTLARLTGGLTEGDLTELHLAEAELRKREAEIGQERDFFHSPALVRDHSQREFIDSLWNAAGVRLIEADLDRRLAYISRLQERVSTIAAATSEERRRKEKEDEQQRASRIEFFLQVASVVLAIASLAEVASLINDGLEHGNWRLIAGEAGLLCALSVVVLVYVFWVRSPTSRRPRPRA